MAAGAIAALLTIPGPAARDQDYPNQLSGLRTGASILQGDGLRSDFAADYVGARALLHGNDPYPVLGPAFEDVGLFWPVEIRSTHPPTIYTLALPFTGFSWPAASALWAGGMLVAIGLAAWAFGLRPKTSAARSRLIG